MIREIITRANSNVTLHLPKEMVGKTVEVIAFEINGENDVPDKAKRISQIEELTKSTLIDLSNFKFDRNEANNYDE